MASKQNKLQTDYLKSLFFKKSALDPEFLKYQTLAEIDRALQTELFADDLTQDERNFYMRERGEHSLDKYYRIPKS